MSSLQSSQSESSSEAKEGGRGGRAQKGVFYVPLQHQCKKELEKRHESVDRTEEKNTDKKRDEDKSVRSRIAEKGIKEERRQWERSNTCRGKKTIASLHAAGVGGLHA